MRPSFLLLALLNHAIERADQVAWQDAYDESQHTWHQLASTVIQTADRFENQGFQENDHVVTILDNGFSAVVTSLAIQLVGAVEIPFGPIVGLRGLPQRCKDLAAKFLISDQPVEWVDGMPPVLDPGGQEMKGSFSRDAFSSVEEIRCVRDRIGRRDPDKPSLILSTSGTTSLPRGVVLSYRALATNAAGKLFAAPQSEGDHRLTVLPLSHAYARTCDLGTWLLSGGRLSATRGWAGLLRAAPRIRPTLINVVPSIARRILQQVQEAETTQEGMKAMGIDRLRMLGCGGAALSAADFGALEDLGIVIIQGYGLTEAGPVVCSASPSDARMGCVGKPIPGVQLRLDSEGRLAVRGPSLMDGYWKDPIATKEKIQAGWLDTGDVAKVHEDGQVSILGRADETIVLDNGRKVYPQPIEQRLLQIPGVRHVVLVGNGKHLRLLIDYDDARGAALDLESSVRHALRDFPRYQRPAEIIRLARPLSEQRGELTAKGTVRRSQVIKAFGRGEYSRSHA